MRAANRNILFSRIVYKVWCLSPAAASADGGYGCGGDGSAQTTLYIHKNIFQFAHLVIPQNLTEYKNQTVQKNIHINEICIVTC